MGGGFAEGVTHSPMIAGGVSVPESLSDSKPSIFKQSGNFGQPRVHLPKENPKYPETKHTMKCAAAPRAAVRCLSCRSALVCRSTAMQ